MLLRFLYGGCNCNPAQFIQYQRVPLHLQQWNQNQMYFFIISFLVFCGFLQAAGISCSTTCQQTRSFVSFDSPGGPNHSYWPRRLRPSCWRSRSRCPVRPQLQWWRTPTRGTTTFSSYWQRLGGQTPARHIFVAASTERASVRLADAFNESHLLI